MPEILVTAETQTNTARMGQAAVYANPETIVLDGVEIPTLSMHFSDLSRFEQKLTIGDYSKDSDALLSTWAQSAWNGGVLIDEHIEGGTDQRSRWSTMWTRSPGQLALNPLAHEHVATSGTGAHRPVGDYDGEFWFAEDTDLQTIDDPATTYALTGVPVATGVEYASTLVIPLGTSGIDIFDGATITNTAGIEAVSLLLWDNKLFALTVDGELLDFDGADWSTPAATRTIPSRETPRKLVAFFDRSGDLTVCIVTSRGIWFWDSAADVIHKSRLDLPPHPDNGLGAVEWRDDGLYYASGLGIYRHSASGVVTAMGFDRDDGVPIEYRGRVKDLVAEHNGVIALLEGDTSLTGQPPETTDTASVAHGPLGNSASFDVVASPSQSAIMIWNEAGWHCLHNFRDIKEPTWMYLSTESIDGWDYTLVCGQEDQLVYIPMPKIFFGPRQLVQSSIQHFEPDGIHITGRFDAGMVGFRKLASHFEVTLRDPQDDKEFEGSVYVYSRTDLVPEWTMIGFMGDLLGGDLSLSLNNAYGRHVFRFGTGDPLSIIGVDQFAYGVEFTWIEFKYEVRRGDDTLRTPIIDSTVLKFIKLPLEGRSWTCTVDLEHEVDGIIGPEQRADFLTRLTTSSTFTKMLHLGNEYRVRVSQVNGVEATGFDGRKAITLSIVHVPIPD